MDNRTELAPPDYETCMMRLHKALYKPYKKIPVIFHSVRWTRKTFHALERLLLVHRPIVDAGLVLERAIRDATPFAAGKMGSDEVRALAVFKKREEARAKGKAPPPYSTYILRNVHTNCGVFPKNEKSFDHWAERYLDAVKACDALAAWDVAGEAVILKTFCPKTTLLQLVSLEPYFSENPWTRSLEGKRVLVISPFVDTIRGQYARRKQVWGNRHVLPDFELLTIRAPLSAGLVPSKHPDWVASFEELKGQMDGLAYDVALIGAGAFSLPLAVHAKARGKIGIHLGGALQILFGVAGHRWKTNPRFMPFFNEAWTGPSKEETPKDVDKKRNGSPDYW